MVLPTGSQPGISRPPGLLLLLFYHYYCWNYYYYHYYYYYCYYYYHYANKTTKYKYLAIKQINYQYLLVNKKQSKAYSKPQRIDLPNSCWCHEVEIRGYRVLTHDLEVPLPLLFQHDRKISKQNFAVLSPDENSENVRVFKRKPRLLKTGKYLFIK